MKALRLVYANKVLPCWECGRALMRATAGEHSGQLIGAVIVVLGIERIVHVRCARESSSSSILTWGQFEKGLR